MSKSIRAALLLYAALAPCAVWAGEPHSPEIFSLSQGKVFEETGGAALYANVCAGCHQPDARGAAGAGAYPALSDNTDIASADTLVRLVLDGQRGMPPVGQMMSDQQIADVINYVRTHFGNAYDQGVSSADVEAARKQKTSLP